MYELVQASEKCYYINCPAKIGVYVAASEIGRASCRERV